MTRCEARSGYAAGDYGEVPIWCHRAIALGSFKDAQGVTRYACQAKGHRIQVKRMFGVWTEPEQADGLTAWKARQMLEQGTATFDAPEYVTWRGCDVEVAP